MLKEMSLKEKIYHLEQITTATYLINGSTYHIITGPNSKVKLDKDMIYEIGTSLNLVGAKTMIEALENYMANSKSKRPPVFMQDVIHGHRTLYPVNLGIAASFDRALAKEVAEKGVIVIEDEDGKIEEDALMEAALEAGASDFEGDEGFFEIYTEPDDVYAISEAPTAQGYKITSAERAKVPSTYVTLTSEEDIEDMQTMLEKFEEYDDITNVYHNWEM